MANNNHDGKYNHYMRLMVMFPNYNIRIRKVVQNMDITDIRIRRIDSEGKMKAVVSVTFDNEFVVHDIKIIESQNGLFIAMPSRRHQAEI